MCLVVAHALAHNATYRYLLTATVFDHTGPLQLRCFDDVSSQLLGISAAELASIREHVRITVSRKIVMSHKQPYVYILSHKHTHTHQDENLFRDKVSRSLLQQYGMSIKVAQETFAGRTSARAQLLSVYPIPIANECQLLAQRISSYVYA